MRLAAALAFFALVRGAAAAAATPSPAPSPAEAARFLLGSWSCGHENVTYAPLEAGSSWIRGVYGKDEEHPEGSETIGFVTALGGFVYRDFHDDGGYAELFAKPPVEGRWVWTGSAYQGNGKSGVVKVRVTYVTTGPALFDRTFERLDGETYVKLGGDSCAKRS